ncbi:LiaI-LiaF-like domain-containing protein [Bacillus andreraoultii]|uniref:LiaI-LiaF-like domain-containing protein n=1 Tax=Bacillus andreraoultii TaxID=1499685 RepID=UPI00053B594C|nr:DUF5668 domain-containing protein [Bacillus andreraoultii]
MKKQIFPSIFLVGIGLYFFLQKLPIEVGFQLFTWPTILLIIGLALLIQAYLANDFPIIIPGILFVGLGIHFHLVQQWEIQLDHVGVTLLFIALGFFLIAKKIKSGKFYSWLFLFLAVIQLFHTNLFSWLKLSTEEVRKFESIWPIALMIIGVYVFIFKRK